MHGVLTFIPDCWTVKKNVFSTVQGIAPVLLPNQQFCSSSHLHAVDAVVIQTKESPTGQNFQLYFVYLLQSDYFIYEKVFLLSYSFTSMIVFL